MPEPSRTTTAAAISGPREPSARAVTIDRSEAPKTRPARAPTEGASVTACIALPDRLTVLCLSTSMTVKRSAAPTAAAPQLRRVEPTVETPSRSKLAKARPLLAEAGRWGRERVGGCGAGAWFVRGLQGTAARGAKSRPTTVAGFGQYTRAGLVGSHSPSNANVFLTMVRALPPVTESAAPSAAMPLKLALVPVRPMRPAAKRPFGCDGSSSAAKRCCVREVKFTL